jgi:hypothetical protein
MSPQSKDHQTVHQRSRRKERPPPINILYQDPKDITKLIKANIKKMNNFYIKRINGSKHILYVDSLENFNQVKELLVKCNTKFYTYTNKSEKPITLLLKGLNRRKYEENKVLNELRL